MKQGRKSCETKHPAICLLMFITWIHFTFSLVNAGTLTGYVQQEGSPVANARVIVESNEPGGAIHGFVMDRTTSLPVSGAEIFIDVPPVFGGSSPHIAVSDASGEYRIEGLTPGVYHLGVWADGYETDYELNVIVSTVGTTERNFIISAVAADDEYLTVIRIKFDTLSFHQDHDEAWFDVLLFDDTPGAASVRNYFYEISHGRMRIKKGVNVLIHCSEPDLQYPHDNYIRDDLSDWALPAANPVIDYAAANLDRFDNNDRTPGADGDIDHVLLIPAGMPQSITGAVDCDMNPVTMWNTIYNLDGKQSGYQTLCPEYSPLGNFVHELMHSMGENYVQDLYIGGDCEDESIDDLSTAAKWSLMDVGMYNGLISVPPDPRSGGCEPYVQPCISGDPDCWIHQNGENPSHPVPWTSRVRWYHGFYNSLLVSESLTAGQSKTIRIYPYESSGPETRTVIAYDPDVSTAYWYITLRLPLGFDHGLDVPGDVEGETGVVIDYTDNALAGTMPLRGPVRVRDSHPGTDPPPYLHFACRFQLDDAAFNLYEVNSYNERSLHVVVLDEYDDGSVQIQVALDAKSDPGGNVPRTEFCGLSINPEEPADIGLNLSDTIRGIAWEPDTDHGLSRWNRETRETLTNALGVYVFDELADGDWDFEIRACGYALFQDVVTVTGMTQNDVTLTQQENLAPEAVITDPAGGVYISPVPLNGADSSDPEFQALSYQWISSIDGEISNLAVDSIFLSPGAHLITLVVSDGFCTDSAGVDITVETPTVTPSPVFSPTPTPSPVFTSTPSPNVTPTPSPSQVPTGGFCYGHYLYSSFPALALPDDGCPDQQIDVIYVPVSATILSVRVRVNILHPFDADLDFYLEHPSGALVELSTDNGSNGDNFIDTVFDDAASVSVTSGHAPFTGSYRPETPLSALSGLSAAGAWTFRICDDMYAGTGTLVSWELCLEFSNPQPTATPTNTSGPPTATFTPAGPPTATPALTPTRTPTAQPTSQPTATMPVATSTPTPTPAVQATNTGTPTGQPSTQTPPSTMTGTPVQTRTPSPTVPSQATQTPTGASTATPSVLPTNSPFPSSTATRTPPPTSSPSPSPTVVFTPTPGGFFCDLLLSETMFEAGTRFRLEIEITNSTGTHLNLHEYLILDVFGSYFFHPSWTLDCEYVPTSISDGYHGIDTVFDFIWPAVSGGAEGLWFYLGYLDFETQELVGNIDLEEFGYR